MVKITYRNIGCSDNGSGKSESIKGQPPKYTQIGVAEGPKKPVEVHRRDLSKKPHEGPPIEAWKPSTPAGILLNDFIANIHLGYHLTDDEARSSLDTGLVELVEHGQHSSNGILLTEDGYFLTAEHCVDQKHDLERLRVRLSNGAEYPLERLANRQKYIAKVNDDIALVKAKIWKEPKVRRYRFHNTNHLDNMPVALMARWNGEVVMRYGFIERNYYEGRIQPTKERPDGMEFRDHFLSSINGGRRGDSGGIIVSGNQSIVGIVSTGGFLSETDTEGAYAGAAKWLNALEVVHYYIRLLEKK